MAITPNTNLRLIKCPLEIDNKNQIKFTSKQAQYNYFNSLPSIKLDDEDISYQRKDSIIAFPDHIDNLWEYNYCMYQNDNYSDKWFYCFITDMKYENDGLTYITIKTDVYQSWQFDLTFMKSFVEREHVNDDTVGKNIMPEGLQLGEYICNSKAQWLNENNYNSNIFNEENNNNNLCNCNTSIKKQRNINNKNSKYTSGRWNLDEHKKFIEAIIKYGNDWKEVQKYIGTRSSSQARSHAQKFFIKLKQDQSKSKISNTIDYSNNNIIVFFGSFHISFDVKKELLKNLNK